MMPVRGVRVVALLVVAAQVATPASAWVLTLTPGPKQLFLMVGVGTSTSRNATINTVSVSVPAASLGNHAPLAMTSDSTQATSPYDGHLVCNPPGQVYVGGSYRQPNGNVGAPFATLQVSTPATLVGGGDAIPFTEISWTSNAIGNPAPSIPAGTFNGGTLFLASIARNTFVEDCLSYAYANSAVVPAGSFSGRATFTLAVP